MSWFRGLKLKLLIILLIGSVALEVSLFAAFDIRDKQTKVINNFISMKIPEAQSIGASTTLLNSMLRYITAGLLSEGDVNFRMKWIALAESAYIEFNQELAQLKLVSVEAKSIASIEEIKHRSHALASVIAEVLIRSKEGTPEADRLSRELILKKILPEVSKIDESFSIISKNFEEHLGILNLESRESSERAEHNMQLVAILSILFLWCFGLTIAFSLSKKLQTVTAKVDNSSLEVAQSSQQLAVSSQELSNASLEQAAALEESSASLQEITGMIESNLKNTEDSVKLARSVISLTAETSETMRVLFESMNEIKKSNYKVEELAKIIEEIGEKTDLIDEIVFQTKLLSFNASVEAERAGEHGRGFGVVAQEVGNLAKMSGKSAIEIDAIVKAAIRSAQEVSLDTKQRVESGFAFCNEAAAKMSEVTLSAQQILSSSEQIYRASKEQNSGIRQISVSVEALNKSTQSNAASAEMSAAASSILFDLSDSLKIDVKELFSIVDGVKLSKTSQKLKVPPNHKLDYLENVVNLRNDVKKLSAKRLNRKASGENAGDSESSGNSDWDSI